jgi:hypothetical protein
MSVKNFKFVSPGVFINEIDNSFLPTQPDAIGPVVVGRSRKGMAMQPIKIESYSDFVEMFGETAPGMAGGDIYRNGNYQSPMYGTYAAKAFLQSNAAPLTYVRLLGQQISTNDGTSAALAGWKTDNEVTGTVATSAGGAYAMFLFESGSGGPAATSTFTFAATPSTNDGTLAIIDTLGTTVTYTAKNDYTAAASSQEYNLGANAAAAAANIVGLINSSDGHNGTITAAVDSDDTAKVNLTQVMGGSDGNTTITSGGSMDSNTTVNASAFTGGTGIDVLGNLGTGSCAAIWYLQNGTIQLSGTLWGTNNVTASAGAYISSEDSSGNYVLQISGTAQGAETFKFNFNDNSQDFIRNQFSTNPQLKGTSAAFYPTSAEIDYWLGETFEQDVRNNGLHNSSSVGIIVALNSGSYAPSKMQGQASREAVAGWFIGQDLGVSGSFVAENKQKLFRLKGRGHGEWLHKNVKVSIERIRQSNNSSTEYGTFSVVLRSLYDTDNNVQVVERFDNCNLNPSSPSFIARKIGDVYTTWDESNKRLRKVGDYPNKSKYVYAEMNSDVEAGASDATLLPFGYQGPPILAPRIDWKANDPGAPGNALPAATASWASFGISGDGHGCLLGGLSNNTTASFKFPQDILRVSASAGGLTDPTDAYFGFSTARDTNSSRSDRSVGDNHRLWLTSIGSDPSRSEAGNGGVVGWSYMFSLDNVRKSGSSYFYESGSRAAGNSVSASGSYKTLLDADYNRFTAPFWGGFDGWDITKPDPIYNKALSDSSTDENNYVYHTIRRALETVADPEAVNMNLLSVPGLTNDNLTGYMVDLCSDRADALALIDLANIYIPPHEEYKSDKADRRGTTPIQAANNLKDRRIDSSYGATFYPWVQTRDSGDGSLVWVPPTVAMMGVLGSSEARSDVWFAPAGFNRGGLTEGAAGIPVTSVSERLTSKERDTLYDARINPIASFPSSGIVVFGQKTLQERQSALDRINVRRLVIYLKKQISILSTQILFEQNVQATWDRFKGLVEPFLANVKTRFGISDYRLVLDESTTTPDLIDRNIMYAKILVKPARAIEFIAIDFVILSTGASFDD